MARPSSTPLTGRARGRARLGLAGGLAALWLSGCPAKQSDCRFDSAQRCAWDRELATPEPEPESESDGDALGPPAEATPAPAPVDQDVLDQTLSSMVDIIGDGLEWALVDERARALCITRDAEDILVEAEVVPVGDDGNAWSCPIASLVLGEAGVFEIEASAGVLSLTAIDLERAAAERLSAYARDRFRGWCEEAFRNVREAKGGVYYRCPLPQGPFLVVARFPRDDEQLQWQVSIAVVDAG